MTEAAIPNWCKPNGWVYHASSNTVFQADRLQRDRASGQLILRDRADREYLLSECQELTPGILKQPAKLTGYRCPLTLRPPTQNNGFAVEAGRFRKGVLVPDLAESAARALADFFNGKVYTESL